MPEEGDREDLLNGRRKPLLKWDDARIYDCHLSYKDIRMPDTDTLTLERKSWKIGDKVEVYNKPYDKWFYGNISDVIKQARDFGKQRVRAEVLEVKYIISDGKS